MPWFDMREETYKYALRIEKPAQNGRTFFCTKWEYIYLIRYGAVLRSDPVATFMTKQGSDEEYMLTCLQQYICPLLRCAEEW